MANLAALHAAVFRYLRKTWGDIRLPPAVRGIMNRELKRIIGEKSPFCDQDSYR